jgi:hypothetical protein
VHHRSRSRPDALRRETTCLLVDGGQAPLVRDDGSERDARYGATWHFGPLCGFALGSSGWCGAGFIIAAPIWNVPTSISVVEVRLKSMAPAIE